MADVITRVGPAQDCSCGSALENAIVTDRAVITQEAIDRLALLVGKNIS